MTAAFLAVRAKFTLHLVCDNCCRPSVRKVSVPDEEDAPSDVDELMESNFLREMAFRCDACDSAIATVMAVTR